MNLDELIIKHDINHQRFFVEVGGGEAYLQYDQPAQKVLDYVKTYVPEKSRNNGIATRLVKYALDFADAKDYTIIATCSFVRSFIEKNPGYKKVLERTMG